MVTPRIHVVNEEAYKDDVYVGGFIELNETADEDEIKKKAREVTLHDSYPSRWVILEYEGFGEMAIRKDCTARELERIMRSYNRIGETLFPAFTAYCNYHVIGYLHLDKYMAEEGFDASYEGEWDSFSEFVEACKEDEEDDENFERDFSEYYTAPAPNSGVYVFRTF